jgi:hypothetical protein
VAGQQDARDYANEIFAHVSHEHTDTTDVGLYLARVVAELFEISPGAREHISDFLIADLCEELGKRGEVEAMRAVLAVQRDWAQGA